MMLSSWQSHCESLPVHLTDADSALCGRQPSNQANRLGLRVRQKEMAATICIHHRHKKWQLPSASTIAILLLLSPRADTHFTVPRRVEG